MVLAKTKFLGALYQKGFPQYVLALKDVIVGGAGLILDNKFNLIPEANVYPNFSEKYQPGRISRFISDIKSREIIDLPDVRYVFMLPSISPHYIYGHFWDDLAMLRKIEKEGLDKDSVLLIARTNKIINLNLHFELFGYKKLLRCSPFKNSYRIKELVYASLDGPPATLPPITCEWLRRKYIHENKKLLPTIKGSTKLYLSRINDNRRAKNEEEVIEFMKSRGFTIITGREGILYHIQQFQAAELIVGAHGSTFCNIIFCERKPRIIEFYGSDRKDLTFFLRSEWNNIHSSYERVPAKILYGEKYSIWNGKLFDWYALDIEEIERII